MTFPKNRLPLLLAAILNFCVKRKITFISETERDRAFSTEFLTTGYMQSLLATSPKNRFPTTFGGHIEFLRKTQKSVSPKQNEIERFQ